MSCNNDSNKNVGLYKTNPAGFYGEPYKPKTKSDITYVLNNSNKLVDKVIEVNGMVNEVCPLRGCWVKIIGNNEKMSIRVKVKDGEIIFPLSAVGRMINVKGTLKKIVFTESQAIQWKIHLAEERGIKLDPQMVELKKEDLFEYRINCTSAQIL